jgi:hypothetical protein
LRPSSAIISGDSSFENMPAVSSSKTSPV